MSDIKSLSPGVYKGKLQSARVSTHKSKGHYQVGVAFDIGYKDRLWINLSMTESANKFVNWQTNVLGADGFSDIADGKTRAEKIESALSKLMNNRYNLEVSYKPFNGQTYQNVIVKSLAEEVPPKETTSTEPKFVPQDTSDDEIGF